MKGFIEVTHNKASDGGKVLININSIVRIEPYCVSKEVKEYNDTRTGIMTTEDLINVVETYEEIKQKIKEAQEQK